MGRRGENARHAGKNTQTTFVPTDYSVPRSDGAISTIEGHVPKYWTLYGQKVNDGDGNRQRICTACRTASQNLPSARLTPGATWKADAMMRLL